MYSEPLLSSAASKADVAASLRRHIRTLQSLEADIIVFGEGKLRARTCTGLVVVTQGDEQLYEHQLRGPPAVPRA